VIAFFPSPLYIYIKGLEKNAIRSERLKTMKTNYFRTLRYRAYVVEKMVKEHYVATVIAGVPQAIQPLIDALEKKLKISNATARRYYDKAMQGADTDGIPWSVKFAPYREHSRCMQIVIAWMAEHPEYDGASVRQIHAAMEEVGIEIGLTTVQRVLKSKKYGILAGTTEKANGPGASNTEAALTNKEE
jgi:hypothetical protein